MSKMSYHLSGAATDTRFPSAPRIWWYGTVTSTFDVARALCARGYLAPWESVAALAQTAGTGQLGREWLSPPGNLYVTLRLPDAPPFSGDTASPATGVLFALTLREMGWPVLLKWPNDLVLVTEKGPRKAGGILLKEMDGVLLAGLGINLASAPPDSRLRADHAFPATCLVPFAGPERLWPNLVIGAVSLYKDRWNSVPHWQDRIAPFLLWRGQSVRVLGHPGVPEGTLLGIGPRGGLLLSVSGRVLELMSGSITENQCRAT